MKTKEQYRLSRFQIARVFLPLWAVFCLSQTNGLFAQDTEDELDDTDIFFLDALVVTAVSEGKSVQEQSVSISSIPVGRTELQVPRSTAELFRSIPGIRTESTAGDGNTNIAIRGMPISAGGAKYLQLHEDGLPVLEFGDIAFATADSFIRSDYNIDTIEAIRGGSASTFASNSPGGVINFISKTGDYEVASIGLDVGVDYDSTRVNFEYGGRIAENWRMHLGGFYRSGEGVRNTGYTTNSGGQLKANLTREFENGYIRVYLKRLDDSVATYLPMPVKATGTNSDPNIGSLAGYNVKTDTQHSSYFLSDTYIDGEGNVATADIKDGLHSVYNSVAAEFDFDLGGGWKLHNIGKMADVSGSFLSPFTADVNTAENIAESFGGEGATLIYANGPNAGQTITDPSSLNGNGMLQLVYLFNTKLNEFDNAQNDLKITKKFEGSAFDSIDVTFGYYISQQAIDMDWHWNGYIMEVKGEDAALVDIVSADGTYITENGLISYGPSTWGYFRKSYDVDYTIAAPYLSTSFTKGKWNVDASVRWDTGDANGNFYNSVTKENVDVNGDGIISTPEQVVGYTDKANPHAVNYDWSYVSYSLGANYTLNDDVSLFARGSKGGRVNADRLVDQLDDSGDIDNDAAVDTATQYEFGVKYYEHNTLPGTLGVFTTFFFAETEETNYEATTQKTFNRTYEAYGVEIEAQYLYNGWDFRLGVTYNDAEISEDNVTPANEGNKPRRVPDFYYSFTTSYHFNNCQIGATLIGVTDNYAQDNNELVLPGYAYINLFGSYHLTDNLLISLAVNNVFDEFGLSESEEGSLTDIGVIRARGISGRSTTLSLRYSF